MGNRRTVSTKAVADQKYMRRRRQKVVRERMPASEARIHTMYNLLNLNGNLKKRSFDATNKSNQENYSIMSQDILANAGVSLIQQGTRSKRNFSLMKQTNSNMILRNPRILNLTTYKNLPKKPVFANSVIKNQNNPFYKADAIRSEFELVKQSKNSRAPVNLTPFVEQMYKMTVNKQSNTLRSMQGITKGGV